MLTKAEALRILLNARDSHVSDATTFEILHGAAVDLVREFDADDHREAAVEYGIWTQAEFPWWE